MLCVEGFSHVGGKTLIRPKELVYALVFGRTPPPATEAFTQKNGPSSVGYGQ